MASIYSDEMKEKILADFSSKNPKVSASIIERFGESPRSKGLGSLNVEEYRNAIDAPLQNTPIRASSGWGQKNALADYLNNIDMGTDELSATLEKASASAGEGGGFKDFLRGQGESLKGQFGLSSILGLIEALYSLKTAGDIEAPGRAPRYKPPKPTEIEGVGGIGMNDGGTVLNRKLFLGGGEGDGIGGERDDLVPIWASDREYVVSANGVRRMGGGNHARGIAALDKINNNGRLI